jgi:hypothetical protein
MTVCRRKRGNREGLFSFVQAFRSLFDDILSFSRVHLDILRDPNANGSRRGRKQRFSCFGRGWVVATSDEKCSPPILRCAKEKHPIDGIPSVSLLPNYASFSPRYDTHPSLRLPSEANRCTAQFLFHAPGLPPICKPLAVLAIIPP